MKEQNFKTHRRLVPGYHYFTYFVVGIVLAFSVRFLMTNEDKSIGLAVGVIGLALGLIGFYARSFALRAQDRAIKAEENLRYFVMTGKLLPKELRLGQIIALRFASDEEYQNLMEQAIQNKLKSIEIKKLIKNWRGDFHRV